jgi:muconate cycloisomerase
MRVIEIPMRFAIQHALATREQARNVLVAAWDERGTVGWGESCPRVYVTGESIDTVKSWLRRSLPSRLVGRCFDSFEDVVAGLTALLDEEGVSAQAAFCACELALLDLAGRRFARSAGDVLGPVRQEEVCYSGVVASEEPETVERMARFMREFEVDAVKVKVGTSLEANRELLGIARRILGEGVSLRVDANCAWSSDEAIHQLEALAEFDLDGVEQPLPAKDLAGMAEVTAAGLVPVVADESLCSLGDAEALIRARGCDVFNIRISKCGGIINAGRIHRRAQAAGLRCQLGAQVGETGILSAAGRHYATRCAPIVWLEGSYGELLLERDLTEPSVTVGKGGRGAALRTPGLGVAPVPRWLEAYTLEVLPLG